MSGHRTIHVALIGVTGVGKSSIVNVLTGKAIAQVDNGVKPCTTKAKGYEVVKADTTYCIWDTRGLNEGKELEKGSLASSWMGQLLGFDAESKLKKLLHDKNPDLALLCVDAKKTGNSDHWSIYDNIFANLPERMKVAVVVTRLRGGDLQDSTWKERCEANARGVFKEFPGASMIEGVPEFNKLDDQEVKDSRDRILTLISESC